MDSVHKKPYEIVVIGEYIGDRKDVESEVSITGTVVHHNIHECVHDSPPPSKKVCLDENPMVSVEPVTSVNKCSNSRGTEDDPDSEQTNTTFCNIPTHCVSMKSTSTYSGYGPGILCHKSIDSTQQITPLCSSMELGDSKQACANSARKDACECTVHTPSADLSQPFIFMCVASQTHSQKPYIGGNYMCVCVCVFVISHTTHQSIYLNLCLFNNNRYTDQEHAEKILSEIGNVC